jgi:hypothetical protein
MMVKLSKIRLLMRAAQNRAYRAATVREPVFLR